MAQAYDEEALRRALQRFMELRSLNPFSWARGAQISPNTLRNFLNRYSHTLTEKTLQKLAAAAHASVAEITGQKPGVVEIPLFGYAGAGDVVSLHDGEPAPVDYVSAPPDMDQPAALIVRGDSMLPRYQEGDTIYFEQRPSPIERSLGRDCVVGLADNRILVKRLERGSRRGRYHLVSINPSVATLHDQAVAWAARIKWIQRRED